ncbi:hypothetical protein Ddye_013059 [Dipteronia dyeriana]|uniref:Reverse transcriptase n=1 Tax=Dipteronia dyeriana TaxID=168575 RepID=A0AAE0CJU2_9ROSI|nr:hypothetical protein Ddye_013059 [Dipteronia dyeriana]
MVSYPSLVGGDFNEILYMSEKTGGAPKQELLIENVRNVLEDYGLRDLGYSSPRFTWSNRRDVDLLVQERLDKCVSFADWQQLFPVFSVEHMEFWNSLPSSGHLEVVLGTMEARLPLNMWEFLDSPFSMEDMWVALFQMDSFKASGVDWYLANFYQRFWSVVGEDVSKALANQLRTILGYVIDESQSAFIPGRQITDNAMVSSECMHALRGKLMGEKRVSCLLN